MDCKLLRKYYHKLEFYKAITLLEYNLAPGKGPLSADPRSSCRKKNNGTKIEKKEIMRKKPKTITKKVRLSLTARLKVTSL